MSGQLHKKGTYHSLMPLLPNVIEIKVEKHDRSCMIMMAMIVNIVDNGRGQNSLTATRDSM
jgi:hypothetical protein